MSTYGDGVNEPYANGGLVSLFVNDESQSIGSDLTPDEARLLGLRLIKMADEAEAQEW